MERRDFLKIAMGAIAGASAVAASAQAAPLLPQPLNGKLPANHDAQPAVTSKEEAERLQPEEVRWGRRWGFRRRWRRRRFWGYRRRRVWFRRRRRFWRRRRYW